MLIAASILLFLLGVVHSYLGERYILIRLFKRDNIPHLLGSAQFTIGTLRFVWHILTVVWWGVAILIYQASKQPLDSQVVLQVFSVVSFISGLFAFSFTKGKHLSWVVFMTIAALLWFAK